jgi:hypothetical protein
LPILDGKNSHCSYKVAKETSEIPLSCQPACTYDKSRCVKNFRQRENPCKTLPAKIKTILFEQKGTDFPWVRFHSPPGHTPSRVLVSKDQIEFKPSNWQQAGVIKQGFFIPAGD